MLWASFWLSEPLQPVAHGSPVCSVGSPGLVSQRPLCGAWGQVGLCLQVPCLLPVGLREMNPYWKQNWGGLDIPHLWLISGSRLGLWGWTPGHGSRVGSSAWNVGSLGPEGRCIPMAMEAAGRFHWLQLAHLQQKWESSRWQSLGKLGCQGLCVPAYHPTE